MLLHADSEDSDQIGWIPRLIRVFAGCTAILLVLSCHGSNIQTDRSNTDQTTMTTPVHLHLLEAFLYVETRSFKF